MQDSCGGNAEDSGEFSDSRMGATDPLLEQLRRFDAIRIGDAGDDQLLSETVERVPPAEDSTGIVDTLHPAIAERPRDRGITVREYDDRTDETLNSWAPDSNSASYSNAHAFWVQIDRGSSTEDAAGDGVAELQHLLRIGTLFTIPTEAHDVIAHASPRDRIAYLIESHAGGIGIVRKVFERWREALETGVRMAEDCQCRSGCPNCIVPPRARDELDKRRGIALARRLLSATGGPYDYESADGLWEPVGQGSAGRP